MKTVATPYLASEEVGLSLLDTLAAMQLNRSIYQHASTVIKTQ